MRTHLPVRPALLACLSLTAFACADPREGQEAPAIQLKSVDGEEFDLAKQEAKVVVLDFWATWCPPCREGLPKLQSAADKLKADGVDVAVYTVNLRESAEKVKAFWEAKNLTLPVLMDTRGAVAQAYDIEGIPTTVILKGGKIAKVHVGLSPNMEQQIIDEVKQLAAE